MIGKLIAVGFTAFLLHLAWDANEFTSFPNVSLPCKSVSDVVGAEDFVVLPDGSVLTGGDDRSWFKLAGSFESKEARIAAAKNGKIVRVQGEEFNDMELVKFPDQDFHPHGLALYQSNGKDESKVFLYVINHRRTGEFVEVFEVLSEESKLHYLRSVHHDLFLGINDLTVLDEDTFYVTNWLVHEPGGVEGVLDALLQRAVSYVLYCDHGECKVVVEGLKMANGVRLSNDGNTLYVVESIGKRVGVYSRHGIDGDVSLVSYIATETLCDNIEADPVAEDTYYLGCHPKGLTFMLHSINKAFIAPSQVLKLTRNDNGSHSLSQLYYNDGSEFAASSGAVVVDGLLYVGSVDDDGVLVCRLAES